MMPLLATKIGLAGSSPGFSYYVRFKKITTKVFKDTFAKG
jgi:hypothetical protein